MCDWGMGTGDWGLNEWEGEGPPLFAAVPAEPEWQDEGEPGRVGDTERKWELKI